MFVVIATYGSWDRMLLAHGEAFDNYEEAVKARDEFNSMHDGASAVGAAAHLFVLVDVNDTELQALARTRAVGEDLP